MQNLLSDDVLYFSGRSVVLDPVRDPLPGGHQLAAAQGAQDVDLSDHTELIRLHVRLCYRVRQWIYIRVKVDARVADKPTILSFHKTTLKVHEVPVEGEKFHTQIKKNNYDNFISMLIDTVSPR